jgi:hypothetical protein
MKPYLWVIGKLEGGFSGLEKETKHCQILTEDIDRENKGVGNVIQRAFLPVTLMSGVFSLLIVYLRSIVLLFPDLANIITGIAIAIIFPLITAMIVPILWVAAESRARVYDEETKEVLQIGGRIRRLVESITGFVGLFQLVTLAIEVGQGIAVLGVIVLILSAIPLTFSMLVYVTFLHDDLVDKFEEEFKEKYKPQSLTITNIVKEKPYPEEEPYQEIEEEPKEEEISEPPAMEDSEPQIEPSDEPIEVVEPEEVIEQEDVVEEEITETEEVVEPQEPQTEQEPSSSDEESSSDDSGDITW